MTAGWEQLLGQPLAQLKQLWASEGAAADVGSDAMEGSPGDVELRTQALVGMLHSSLFLIKKSVHQLKLHETILFDTVQFTFDQLL